MFRDNLIELGNRRQIHKRIPLHQQRIILQKLRFLLLGERDAKLRKAALKSLKIIFFHTFLRLLFMSQIHQQNRNIRRGNARNT